MDHSSGAYAPPAKRARTDDDETPAPMTRSDIWHSDGNLVLQVGTTQFRVHWGVLSTHSSVFKDMQSIPQPDTAEPLVEGCPLVELYDDPLDVENVLRLLYDPTVFLQSQHEFAFVAALIRMGRKYDFQNLWNAGLGILEAAIPTTLAQYDALRDVNYRVKGIVKYPALFIDILSLLRENNIMTLLPCAYYLVIYIYSVKQLFDGVARGDGTTAILAPEILRQCIVSKEKIIGTQSLTGYALYWTVTLPTNQSSNTSGCANVAICTKNRLLQVSRHAKMLVLLPPAANDENPGMLHGLCPYCRDLAAMLIKVGRQNGWENLPNFFDLARWDELKNEG
ncbi:BTB domain-containing protein [Mycena indigotica]|uniref:BTB domain-containing protein n=1 Tax=Mycena indigotica TaxID=2126181 RepID=A0A8H6WEU2_9AGAR|nr:BTB domain-containing protein [Mycena indigotica]KAF7315167.1 BTB domain-containing protein [Mycena indigotica]